MTDLAARITEYEQGELSEDEIVDLFQDLLANGIVWELQGSYQRVAEEFISRGLIS